MLDSRINYGFNKPITSPQFMANQGVSKPVEYEEKHGISSGAKLGIGLGLLALAATGYYIVNRGKTKTSGGVSSQVDNLQKQINELKEKIKTNYLKEEAEIFERKNKDVLTLNDISYLHVKHKEEGINHIGAKSIDDLNYLIKEYTEPSGFAYGLKSKEQAKMNEFSKNVRNRLSELQNDSVWLELRKIRKQILKDKKSRRVNNTIITKDVNELARLELINEALYSKYHGTKTDFMKMFDLSLDDILKLIKDPKVGEKYDELLKSINYAHIKPAISGAQRLHIGNFVNTSKYLSAKENVNFYNNQLKNLIVTKNSLQEEINTLKEKYLNSDDVKIIKELIKKRSDNL